MPLNVNVAVVAVVQVPYNTVIHLEIDGDEETYLLGSREEAVEGMDVLSLQSPLGRAVIGGLIFATAATLFFVPVFFSIVHGSRDTTIAESN